MVRDSSSKPAIPFAEKIRTQSIEATAATLMGTCQYYYDRNQGLRGRPRESLRIYDYLYDEVLKHLLPNSEGQFRNALWDIVLEYQPAWFPMGRALRSKR